MTEAARWSLSLPSISQVTPCFWKLSAKSDFTNTKSFYMRVWGEDFLLFQILPSLSQELWAFFALVLTHCAVRPSLVPSNVASRYPNRRSDPRGRQLYKFDIPFQSHPTDCVCGWTGTLESHIHELTSTRKVVEIHWHSSRFSFFLPLSCWDKAQQVQDRSVLLTGKMKGND